MSETIVIESNRQISYRSTIEAEQTALINDTNTTPKSEYPNHEWTTFIENGVKLNVGDRLNIEASMINTRGSPEETMEFSGGQSKIGDNPLVDNVVELSYAFYINNRQQFNFNYPKVGHTIDFRWNGPNYGEPAMFDRTKFTPLDPYQTPTGTDVQNFAYFIKNYPYEKLEGFSNNNASPPITTFLTDGLLTKCRIDMAGSGPQKLYKTLTWWEGPTNIAINHDTSKLSNFLAITPVALEVSEGFNSPATVGEYLTGQFHNRSGAADNWDVSEVQGGAYNIDATSGQMFFKPRATITDQTYITTPTSTGSLLYGRSRGFWNATFDGEKTSASPPVAIPVGSNYSINQGQNIYWANVMCGDIRKTHSLMNWRKLALNPKAATAFNGAETDSAILAETNTFSGFDWINSQGVADFGYEVCLLDSGLQSTTIEGFTYSDWTGTPPTVSHYTTQADTEMLAMGDGECIVLNVIANLKNIVIFKETFRTGSYQNSATNPIVKYSPSSGNNNNVSWNQRINFQVGRTDDEYSGGFSQQNMNLVNPRVAAYVYAEGGPPEPITGLPNSYQLFANHNYDGKSQTNFALTKRLIQNPVVFAGGNDNMLNWTENRSYEIPLYTTMRKEFDPRDPSFVLTLPPNSLFSFQNTSGNYFPIREFGIAPPPNIGWDTDLSGYPALVVVYYAEGQAPYTSMIDVPFISVICSHQVGIDEYDIKIPLPIVGEIFGVSKSLMDNSFSKPISTMKTDASSPYEKGPPIKPLYPAGTAPQDYMPYCYIGADNPLIKFDPDFSRFSIESLHTATRTGNGIFQLIEATRNTEFAQTNILMQSTECMISGIDNLGAPVDFLRVEQAIFPNPSISSQAGIGIIGLRIPTVSQIENGYLVSTNKGSYDLIPIYVNRPNQFNGCLLSKMGFELEQIVSTWGLQQNEFNKYNATKFVGYPNGVISKTNNMVYPLTTNAFISSSLMLSTTTNIAQYPMENLAGIRPNQEETNGDSDKIIALNLPSKLDYSYLVVYSDIVPNVKYYGGANGEQTIPALTYISRNYSTGDFFYSFSTDWSTVIDKSYVLSHFTVSIRLPNGKPAPVSDNSSIIFKVVKPKILPPQIIEPEKEIKKEKEKK